MNDDEKLTSVSETEPEAFAAEKEDPETNWAEEAKKYQNLYLRGAAEMENMRRRFQKEREEQARYACERIVKGVLPVLDNLELALSYVKEDAPSDVQSLAEGVRLTLKGLMDVLADNGVKAIEAERGQLFDPNVHEALGQMPEPGIAHGAICQSVQCGYTLNDRLIRPSKVMIAINNAE